MKELKVTDHFTNNIHCYLDTIIDCSSIASVVRSRHNNHYDYRVFYVDSDLKEQKYDLKASDLLEFMMK